MQGLKTFFSLSSKRSTEIFLSVRQCSSDYWTPFTYVGGGSKLWELLWASSMTWQSGRPSIQMQYVRHLLIDNCWLGWWCGKSDLQCLELSRRQIKHVGSHSRVVSFNTIIIVRKFSFIYIVQGKSFGFKVHVYSRFTG